jgi:hypothetical protein
LKPFLSAQEVESHCSDIQGLHDQQSPVYADSLPAGGSFKTFSIGPTNASGVESTDSSETFKGYSGVFLPETLQRIQNSSEVGYHSVTLIPFFHILLSFLHCKLSFSLLVYVVSPSCCAAQSTISISC